MYSVIVGLNLNFDRIACDRHDLLPSLDAVSTLSVHQSNGSVTLQPKPGVYNRAMFSLMQRLTAARANPKLLEQLFVPPSPRSGEPELSTYPDEPCRILSPIPIVDSQQPVSPLSPNYIQLNRDLASSEPFRFTPEYTAAQARARMKLQQEKACAARQRQQDQLASWQHGVQQRLDM